ncbi:hypothetical protein SLEP1_g25110 [Rubroshorea leprosula]|uniref:cellulase n=1 Tax=Rubroshorea leprosula TaxID=152421 RepID=A0AAV5JRL0_9ROSI|nr:hypothetical protein SLEP1_g25110 [Rubroshorea leprosula]
MWRLLLILVFGLLVRSTHGVAPSDYGDALSKSLLFFEAQRSGKLPQSQRVKWRQDSSLRDGFQSHVDLVGGYYSGGDNLKSSFEMAYSITMLSWSVLEFGSYMELELQYAKDAIRWGTDFLLKATNSFGYVYIQVGNQNHSGQNCWQRPEDLDYPRQLYNVSKQFPGSDVTAEIASALAASSMVFKHIDPAYAAKLLERSEKIFEFSDKNRGSYIRVGPWVCPSGCSAEYEDELIWAAAWLYNATKLEKYRNYIFQNMSKLEAYFSNGSFSEFGWDNKHAGINVLISKLNMTDTESSHLFLSNADKLVCSLLPNSGTSSASFLQGGLLFKQGGSSLEHATALSFLLLVYGRTLGQARRQVYCGETIVNPEMLTEFARSQVDYILGNNPLGMSFMVGYGNKYPQRIRHKGSSLPSKSIHPKRIDCKEGLSYYNSSDPNQNLLIGAVVGGPDINGVYDDSRKSVHSEPKMYINAPLVGVLAYLKSAH